MKLFKIIIFLFGIYGITALGCKKTDGILNIYRELSLKDENTAIIDSFNGVVFQYCLLKEEGLPATTFNEGQNFSFFFSLTNKTNDKLDLDNNFFQPKCNFCKVYNINNTLIGLPFIYKGQDEIGSAAHPFYGPNNKYELTVPWKDDRNEWQTISCHLESTHQNLLPKGKYYTLFSHRFCFDQEVDQPTLCTDSLTLKINFEIK